MQFNMFFFYSLENQNDQSKNILFVMEYADGGTLTEYLKKTFDKLNWNDKYSLAYQLAYAVSFLHTEGIVHHDLVICSNVMM